MIPSARPGPMGSGCVRAEPDQTTTTPHPSARRPGACLRLGVGRPAAAGLLLGLAGIASGSAVCPPDFDDDGQLTVFDVIGFFDRFVASDPAADLAPDGVLNLQDILAFFDAMSAGCDFGADADGDGLSDERERSTLVYKGPLDPGTDPNNPDTDGDGLLDGVEVFGTEDGLDLPAMGVNPLRRDILVEVDWHAGVFGGFYRSFRPDTAMIAQIRDAYAAAPLINADGTTGINCIIDYGQGGVFTGGNQLPGTPSFVGLGTDTDALKADHFDPRRRGIFHYAVFTFRSVSSTNRGSGVAELHGDDLIVSLVDYRTSYNGAVTFVHELGHNFGLRHGGFENRNFKPNYRSVMNYRYQFPGRDVDGDAVGDFEISYSTGGDLVLDERQLDETLGLGLGVPIDWNRDTKIDSAAVSANVNCRAGVATACGHVSSDCGDSTCGLLFDFDDWSAMDWSRLDAGMPGDAPKLLHEDAAPETIVCENWPGEQDSGQPHPHTDTRR